MVQGFFEEVVPAMTDEQNKAHFRLTRTTTQRALQQVDQGEHFEKKLLLFLYYIGSIISFKKVATLFGISVSSAWRYVDCVLTVLLMLKDRVIRLPSDEACVASANAVQQAKGFYGFVGAVDGCHIPIERPREDEHTYVNRKGYHSLVLMGVCDENMIFTDINVGWPGSVHDSRIFKNTSLGKSLQTAIS